MSRARGGTIRSAVVDRGNPSTWHGGKATTTVGCKSDDEVLTGLLDVIPNHNFTFGRFTGLADVLGCKSRLSFSPSHFYTHYSSYSRDREPINSRLLIRLTPRGNTGRHRRNPHQTQHPTETTPRVLTSTDSLGDLLWPF